MIQFQTKMWPKYVKIELGGVQFQESWTSTFMLILNLTAISLTW